MCIIIAKPSGKDFPTKEIFKECFDRNDDGAGLMFQAEDSVKIHKGFMEFDKFHDHVETLREDKKLTTEKPAIFHFRIGTSGNRKSRENTHPFPVSNKIADLRHTRFTTDIGMVHNGMISDIKLTHNNSDTQEFVKKHLSRMVDGIKGQDKDIHEEIKKLAGYSSKFAFMTPEKVTILGAGWVDDEGIKYSNSSFKVRKPYVPYVNPHTSYRGDAGYYKDGKWIETGLRKMFMNMVQDFWDYYTVNGFDFEKAVDLTYHDYKFKLDLTYSQTRGMFCGH